MGRIRKVYLGGPEVFLPEVVELFEAKEALCAEFDFSAIVPGGGAQPRKRSPMTDNAGELFSAIVQAMRESDFAVFDLTPFRGPSADVGTVFELGFIAGLGKPVFGYTNIAADYLDRIALRQETKDLQGNPTWRDENGWVIENYGGADNLMIDEGLNVFGAPIVRRDVPLPSRLRDLTGFKDCLRQAQTHYDGL